MEVLTGEQGAIGEATDLVLVMCGDKGESSPIKFHSTRDRPFQPQQNDTAEVVSNDAKWLCDLNNKNKNHGYFCSVLAHHQELAHGALHDQQNVCVKPRQ